MSDTIICGVATVLNRKLALKDVIKSILPQVDKLIVYQNGYSEVFDFLKDDKIEVYSSINVGIDMGDGGKFYKVSEYNNAYYLSIDDDLLYPPDYVSNIITNIENYNRECIVTHHGRTLKPNAIDYYHDVSSSYRCLGNVSHNTFIQFGGTGVMGFHTSKVKFNFNYIKTPNMADIWVGLFAQENLIPIVVLKHRQNWIKYLTNFNQQDTIFNRYVNNNKIQNELIKKYQTNKLIIQNK